MNMGSHQLDKLPSSRNPKAVVSDSIHQKKKQIGVLEVYIHQARDIPNICIYHKQDVYAKIYLTSDPETTVSSRIIHGGGQEPVFNETLQLSVQTLDSSLKCEIWMLSRIKNYLQDQFLGSASVPLSDVVLTGQNGKVFREFCLSSSDLVHSQAGFVRLSLAYVGGFDVFRVQNSPLGDSDTPVLVPCELDRIDFPDLKIMCENEMMVSEYLEVSESKVADTSEMSLNSTEDGEFREEKVEVAGQADRGSPGIQSSTIEKPIHSVKFEAKAVVQQDFVDMYMKSMQQFTESLANMKLPFQTDDGLAGSEGRGSIEKGRHSTSSVQGPRVFYGSRAFF